MSALVCALLLALVALVAAGVFWGRILWHAHLHRVAHEKTHGHLRLRRRMANLTRRNQDECDKVLRAETMYGHVWIAMTRRSRHPFQEAMGWTLTQRGARRQLARHRGE